MIGLLGPDDHRTRRTPGRLIAAQRSETVGGAQVEGGSAAGPSAAASARRPARAVRWLRRRPTVAAALIYLVLSLVMVGQGLLPGRTLSASDVLYSDVALEGGPRPPTSRGWARTSSWPTRSWCSSRSSQYTRRRPAGTRPCWNPHILAGRPFLADAQSAVFSPLQPGRPTCCRSGAPWR